MRGRRRVLTLGRGLLGSLALVLAAADLAPSAEPVWCHEVRRGDTLSSIARRHATSAVRLRRLNGLAPDGILAVQRVLVLPNVVRLERGDLPLAAPPLLARPGRLVAENAAATADGLSRMKHVRMVARFRHLGRLVPVPASTRTFYVASIAPALRVARPWTRRFVQQLGAAFHALFDRPIRVSSLIRTAASQRALRLTNASAAPADGPASSTHRTGAAVDISKRGLTNPEIMWVRYLRYAGRLPSPLVLGGC